MVPRGTVYAVDLEPDMVKYLGERARREKLPNLIAVQAAPGDARLPVVVDLALLVDVYHHLEARTGYFVKLTARRVAVIDFRPDSKLGPRAGRVAPETVKREMAAAGYVLAADYAFLPNQYFLIFAHR
jgi:SAM-dependent methyltransferase